QYITDLSKLPDYEDGNWYGRGNQAAPVDDKGDPIFYSVPKSYEDAKSDGQRWRWLLAQTVEDDAHRANETDLDFATFLHQQYGKQTLESFGFEPRSDDRKNDTGTYALHTLTDDETIARLATGVKRFTLPDEFNFIKVYERIAGRGKTK